ncbi:unnamed protein product [Rhodiola kirilowii]
MTQNILCWNARDANNKGTIDYLKTLKSSHNIGVCVILEPKADSKSLAKVALALKFSSYTHFYPENTHIWLLWDNPFNTLDPWFLAGDFNVISSWSEKKGGNNSNHSAMTDFNNFIAQAGILDAGFLGPPFTWSNNRQGNNRIWERLDRVLLNGRALADFPEMQVTHLPRVSSDYCPLLLSLSQLIKIKRGFKFSAAWTMHDNFLTLVSTHWADHAHDDPLRNFAMKLKRLRRCLTKWNWETFGNVHKIVIEKQNLVDSLEKRLQTGWNNDTNQEVIQAKKDLSTYLRYQYSMLEEKSRIDWLRDGDRNTALMHADARRLTRQT